MIPVFTPADFIEALRHLRPTVMFGAPGHVAACLQQRLFQGVDLSSLRIAVLSGTTVPPALSAAFEHMLPNGKVMQAWGMTELQFGACGRPSDAREDAQMTMWALWAATDCEPHTLQILYHRPDLPAGERNLQIYEASLETLKRPFEALDQMLRDGGGYLVGRRFTVADINAAEVMRYAQPAKELFAANPAVQSWITACQARPAYRDMMAEREKEPA